MYNVYTHTDIHILTYIHIQHRPYTSQRGYSVHYADPDCVFVKNAYRSMLRSLELFHADAIAMRELFGDNTIKYVLCLWLCGENTISVCAGLVVMCVFCMLYVYVHADVCSLVVTLCTDTRQYIHITPPLTTCTYHPPPHNNNSVGHYLARNTPATVRLFETWAADNGLRGGYANEQAYLNSFRGKLWDVRLWGGGG